MISLSHTQFSGAIRPIPVPSSRFWNSNGFVDFESSRSRLVCLVANATMRPRISGARSSTQTIPVSGSEKNACEMNRAGAPRLRSLFLLLSLVDYIPLYSHILFPEHWKNKLNFFAAGLGIQALGFFNLGHPMPPGSNRFMALPAVKWFVSADGALAHRVESQVNCVKRRLESLRTK